MSVKDAVETCNETMWTFTNPLSISGQSLGGIRCEKAFNYSSSIPF